MPDYVKSTIYFTPEQLQKLKDIAHEQSKEQKTKITQSHIVRKALEKYLEVDAMYCQICERETQPTFVCPVYNQPSNQSGCAWSTSGQPACVDHWEDAPCQGTEKNICEHCGKPLD